MSLGMMLGLGQGDFVLDGDHARSPSPKRPPKKNSAHVYCGQTAGWMKLVLSMEVGLIPGDFVLDGTQPPRTKGAKPPPQFSAHFCCGQTAGCIKMPLCMDVGLSPGDFVLDGDPVPPPQQRGGAPQIFGPCIVWPNGWMDQDATWHGGICLSQATLCSMRTKLPPEKRAHPTPPNFWPMSIVAKRLDG